MINNMQKRFHNNCIDAEANTEKRIKDSIIIDQVFSRVHATP